MVREALGKDWANIRPDSIAGLVHALEEDGVQVAVVVADGARHLGSAGIPDSVSLLTTPAWVWFFRKLLLAPLLTLKPPIETLPWARTQIVPSAARKGVMTRCPPSSPTRVPLTVGVSTRFSAYVVSS